MSVLHKSFKSLPIESRLIIWQTKLNSVSVNWLSYALFFINCLYLKRFKSLIIALSIFYVILIWKYSCKSSISHLTYVTYAWRQKGEIFPLQTFKNKNAHNRKREAFPLNFHNKFKTKVLHTHGFQNLAIII